MAIHWKTTGLLLALLGVGLVGLLHHHSTTAPGERAEPSSFYTPSPTQEAHAYAALTAPRGFGRSSECADGTCFERMPSVVPALPALKRWLAEAGLAWDENGFPSTQCKMTHIGRSVYRMITCAAAATQGNATFSVMVSSLAVEHAHALRGTRHELGVHAPRIGGTKVTLYYLGVPRPATVRFIRKELLHHPGALIGLPLPGKELLFSVAPYGRKSNGTILAPF